MRAITLGFLLLCALVQPAHADSAGARALAWAESQRDAALGAVAVAQRRLDAAESDLAVSRTVERDISGSKDTAAQAVAREAVSVSERGVLDARALLQRARALLSHWQDTIASIKTFIAKNSSSTALVVPAEGKVRHVMKNGATFDTDGIQAPPRSGETVVAGPGSSARVFTAGGHAEIVLTQNSSLTITRDEADDSFEALLNEGFARIRVQAKKYSRKFEVRTPTVAVAVRGTDFSVRTAPSGSRVEVFESTVLVTPAQGGEGVEVHAGEGCDILNEGGIQPVRPLPAQPRNDPWSEHVR